MNIYPATFHGRVADQRKSPLLQKQQAVINNSRPQLFCGALQSRSSTEDQPAHFAGPRNKCGHQIARLLPHTRKIFQQSVWFEDCNVSNYSGAKLPVVRTMPSEVVSGERDCPRRSRVHVHNHAFRGRFSENQPKEFLTCLCVVVSEAV